MTEKITSVQTGQNPSPPTSPVGYLQHESESWQMLFNVQPAIVQRFLEAQGNPLAEALIQQPSPAQVRFKLPDRVCVEVRDSSAGQPVTVPLEMREQLAGGL